MADTKSAANISKVPGYLTTHQAAQRLHCARSWVTRMCQKGKIPAKQNVGGHWFIKEEVVRRLAIEGADDQ